MKTLVKILSLLAIVVCATACEKSGELKQNKDRVFSVSTRDKVLFAPGNLQFLASEGEWRFAEKQYDIIGEGNTQIGESATTWIDLFGWGATGAEDIQPWDTQSDYEHYIPTVKDIAGTERDWGIRTSNGFFGGEQWYTLSRDEWDFILNKRPNAKKLYSRAYVAGLKGLLLLPDKWKQPNDIRFTPEATAFAVNNYSIAEWKKLEATGAVFLPCAGLRRGKTEPTWTGNEGCYWTSSIADGYDCYASQLQFSDEVVRTIEADPSAGRAVRLARKIK